MAYPQCMPPVLEDRAMPGVSFQEAGCENDLTLLEELINSSNFHLVQHKLQIYLEMLNLKISIHKKYRETTQTDDNFLVATSHL